MPTVRAARARRRAAHVRAARAFRHPLPGGPKFARIARRQPFERARLLGGRPERFQHAGGAVGHGERTGIKSRTRMKQIKFSELKDARRRTVGALVRRRDEAFFGRRPVKLRPTARDLHVVDALTPRRVPNESRRVGFGFAAHGRDVAEHARRKTPEIRLDRDVNLRRKATPQDRAQSSIGLERIRQLRRSLIERFHGGSPRFRLPSIQSAPQIWHASFENPAHRTPKD